MAGPVVLGTGLTVYANDQGFVRNKRLSIMGLTTVPVNDRRGNEWGHVEEGNSYGSSTAWSLRLFKRSIPGF
jgi:hypothetical protein